VFLLQVHFTLSAVVGYSTPEVTARFGLGLHCLVGTDNQCLPAKTSFRCAHLQRSRTLGDATLDVVRNTSPYNSRLAAHHKRTGIVPRIKTRSDRRMMYYAAQMVNTLGMDAVLEQPGSIY
jgi:hypothetical protein